MMISPVFSSLLILITICLKTQVFSSPVLLWINVNNLPQTAVHLSTITSLDLISNYICTLTNEQIELRLLAVNDLTIEDIQRGPKRDHPLLLEAKEPGSNFRYYPNVANDIFTALSLLPQSNNMKCSHIHFQISSSNTYESLNNTLNIMETLIEPNTDNPVVIVALVNNPSDSETLARKRRQVAPSGNNVLIFDKTCMFYAEQLVWNNANGTKATGQIYTLLSNGSSCQTNTNTSTATLDLLWKNQNAPFDVISMSLITTIIGRYWYLESATINTNEYRYFAFGMNDQMVTPPGYSYACGNAVFVQYNSSIPHGRYNFDDKFFLTNLQFQPFNGSGLAFGPPNYCTSFFTSGIWMGIVTSLLCLGILLVAVRRMMTIKSNDRFDDPKGKPLLIKPQE